MSDKDKKSESKFFSSKEEKKAAESEDKPVAVKSNNPNAPMRRKNRVINDGEDWFDTHPDA
tara:strand:+ start:1648 stop:1830 length:183 start_codon:yes stop_codon:yes gene_type:complete